MLQNGSVLKVADNTGARALRVITVLGSHVRAGVGHIVSGSVQGVLSGDSIVADHEVVHAVVVRTRKERSRVDGSYIRFDDNACVIVDAKGQPRGTRIFGPIAREVREAGFQVITNLAPEVV